MKHQNNALQAGIIYLSNPTVTVNMKDLKPGNSFKKNFKTENKEKYRFSVLFLFFHFLFTCKP
ncbi:MULTISPECIES: TasA family protein [Bacillus]|uniref:TasA family protein n=1 Tax=Bacillus TaxID=1386 RepID=UPI0033922ED1